MTNLSVLITIRTEWFETFVLFICYECITSGTVSLLFTYELFPHVVSFVSVKTCTIPKLSITRLARDSNISVWTWRN